MFKNREDAAKQLVKELTQYKDTDCVILAIPRGGIPIGKIIAEFLHLPLDIILSKKLTHPTQKEYAIGALSLQSRILEDTEEVPEKYIQEETDRVRQILKARYTDFYKNRSPLNLQGKTVIVVDDGIATGLTLLSTLSLLRLQQPKKIIVAVPVAALSGYERIKSSPFVDDIICLHIPDRFYAVGQYYEDFKQVKDAEAIQLINEAI